MGSSEDAPTIDGHEEWADLGPLPGLLVSRCVQRLCNVTAATMSSRDGDSSRGSHPSGRPRPTPYLWSSA